MQDALILDLRFNELAIFKSAKVTFNVRNVRYTMYNDYINTFA